MRPGFTLLEGLLCVAVVAILIAIVVPLLAHSRERGKDVRSLALLGQHARAFTSYAADYKDTWPYLSNPSGPTELRTDEFAFTCKYFDVSTFWHLALSRHLYGVTWNDMIFKRDGWTNGVWTPYWYSPAFMAHPSFWTPESRVGPSQWTATTTSAVRYPSAKALFTGPPLGERSGNGWQMAFVDTSASTLASRQLVPGIASGVGAWENGSDWLDYAYPGMVTLNGVHGRDRH